MICAKLFMLDATSFIAFILALMIMSVSSAAVIGAEVMRKVVASTIKTAGLKNNACKRLSLATTTRITLAFNLVVASLNSSVKE